MAATLNYQFFEPLKGRTINTEHADGSAVELLLKKVDRRNDPPAGFEVFTLIFDGPVGKILSQGTYLMRCDELDEWPLFLVPVAGDDQGYQYEAVFNIKAG